MRNGKNFSLLFIAKCFTIRLQTFWTQTLYQRSTVLAFTGLMQLSEWACNTEGFLAKIQTLSQRYKHTDINIQTQSKELATLGSDLCRAHRPTGFSVLLRTVSQDSVMRADRKDCADVEQGAKLGLKNTQMQKLKLQMPMPSNEPYSSFYRNEEGTNIPVAHRIIDTWKVDHRFRVTPKVTSAQTFGPSDWLVW